MDKWCQNLSGSVLIPPREEDRTLWLMSEQFQSPYFRTLVFPPAHIFDTFGTL